MTFRTFAALVISGLVVDTVAMAAEENEQGNTGRSDNDTQKDGDGPRQEGKRWQSSMRTPPASSGTALTAVMP
jgi:hypothetical protein